MRKTIVAVIIAVSAAILGGCAGSLPSGSPLPMGRLEPVDSVGEGLPSGPRMGRLDSVGEGLPSGHRLRHLDSVGEGLPSARRMRHHGSVQGLPSGYGRHLDSVGEGLPGKKR